MAKRIVDTNNVRDRLGEMLDQAHYRGDEFIIQRRGKPLAALVPYSTYERFERRRKAAFRVFHEIWEANKDADPEEVAKAVERAVAEVRGERESKKRR